MAWDGKGNMVDYTWHCTECFGLYKDHGKIFINTAMTGHCASCESTGRTPIPWAELFRARRPE